MAPHPKPISGFGKRFPLKVNCLDHLLVIVICLNMRAVADWSLPCRDMAHQSSIKGASVAWIGEYGDIVNGHEGQYRVRLLDNKSALGIPDIPD